MNDTEREEWIKNDEGLYCWWRGSRQPLRKFVRENRPEIDRSIELMRSGKKQQHYLRYG